MAMEREEPQVEIITLRTNTANEIRFLMLISKLTGINKPLQRRIFDSSLVIL